MQMANKILVSYNGAMKWLAPMTLTFSCILDVTYFPWDTETCTIVFGSWSYEGSKINMLNTRDILDTFSLLPHAEWEIEREHCKVSLIKDVQLRIILKK